MGKKQSTTKYTSNKDKENVCLKCSSICCRDLAIEIKRPRDKYEINELKWRLHFDTVRVYILNRQWHMMVSGNCMYLDKDDLCTIYDRRPDQCREHNPPDCEKYLPYYDTLISTPEELDTYLNKGKVRKKRK